MNPHTCPECGHQLQIPERYAGQRGKCKHCGAYIQVPEPGETPSGQSVDSPPGTGEAEEGRQEAPGEQEVVHKAYPAPVVTPRADLTACRRCGKEVSVHAQNCPHCGEPFTVQNRGGGNQNTTIVIICIVMGIVVIAVICGFLMLFLC